MTRLTLYLLAFFLAGCTSLPPQKAVQPDSYLEHVERISAINSFAVVGRIAVLTESKGFSGSMRWHHRPDGDDIAFYSPLGTQLGQLSSDTEGVTLTTSSQKVYQAEDAEALTQQALGWSLPMSGLPDWVLGRPAAGDVDILAWDEAGHISRMHQQGWDIEYPAYRDAENLQLPAKVLLKSQKLDLKLVIETWQTDAE